MVKSSPLKTHQPFFGRRLSVCFLFTFEVAMPPPPQPTPIKPKPVSAQVAWLILVGYDWMGHYMTVNNAWLFSGNPSKLP